MAAVIQPKPVVCVTTRSVTTCVLSPDQVQAILANYLTRELEEPVSPDAVTLKATSVEIVIVTEAKQ